MSARVSVAVYRPDGLQYPDETNALLGVYDNAGHELVLVRNGAALTFFPGALAVSNDGSIYLGGAVVPPTRFTYQNEYVPEVRKYHRDGILQWSINPGAIPNSLAIDASTGDLLITGRRNNDGDTTHKYSAEGELIWSIDNGLVTDASGISTAGAYGCIAVDSAGAVYTATAHSGAYSPDETAYYLYTGMLTKWTSAGVFVWEYFCHGEPKSLIVDSTNGVLYYSVVRAFVDDVFVDVLKIDADDGSVLASGLSLIPPSNNRANEKLVLTSNVLYGVGINAYAQYDTTDLSQTATWAVSNIYDLAVDTDDQHYFATSGSASSNPGTIGDFVVNDDYGWAASLVFEVQKAYVYCINVAVIESPELHGLHLPLALSAPTTQGDLYVVASALPLNFSLQAPRWLLEPSQYGSITTRYRATVTGSPLLILSISSFQFRWESGSRSLSVVVPAVSDATVTTLQARADESLTLQSGFLVGASVPVQYVDFFSVPITRIRVDTGSRGSSLTIAGELAQVASNPQPRVARGVSYRNTQNGLRRVRCDLDLYLQPGDTLDLGGETMIVGELSGYASATQAVMEIVEAGT